MTLLFIALAEPFIRTHPLIHKFNHHRRFFPITVQDYRDMEYSLPPPVMGAPTCSVASEMTGDVAGSLSNFVEQEESSIMESPKRVSSEWTDEKHSLYLKSMEASFIDQLYNSLDKFPSRKAHANTHYPSGEFKVLQHGSWSRIDFKRGKSVVNRPHVSSSNPWIQHFRRATDSPSTQVKPTSTATSQQTSDSNTEVTDQNFVEEDSSTGKVSTPCGKKRKNTCAVSKLGHDQAASFWHLSGSRNY